MNKWYRIIRVAAAGVILCGAAVQGGLCVSLTGKIYNGVFRELPVTTIQPEGWLKETLELQRDGMALNRYACGYPFNTALWIGKTLKPAWQSYEQTAYFVDGVYRCGLLLNDAALLDTGLSNIRYVLDHPETNGHLGPVAADFRIVLDPDGVAGPSIMGAQWPFTVFTRALIAYYQATGDRSLLEALAKHYLTFPEKFGIDNRDVDAIEGMCWLYLQTGDARFVRLAERTWLNFVDSPSNTSGKIWTLEKMTNEEPLRGHGVSASEISKQAAILYLATGKKEYLDAATGAFRSLQRDHELVDGVLSSDSGLSGKEPIRQHETCVIIDYTWSLGYMLMASGDAHWADTIERAIYNAAYSVQTKDQKTLQYYGAPNQMNATQTCNHPNTGTLNRSLQAYRPDHAPECCTGNLQRMFPDFIGRMWMGDGAGGIAAVFYGPGSVSTRAGAEGAPVTIQQKTDYPFNGAVELKVTADKPVKFPLYLRIPGWAEGATVEVDGQPVAEQVQPGTFLKLERTFANGSTVKLNFPMKLRKETPVAGGITLVRGPLIFSLKIGEEMTRVDDTLGQNPDFPAWDVTASTPWNYGLVLKTEQDLDAVTVAAEPVTNYPWTPETAPVVLTASARKIPSWKLIEPYGETPALPSTNAVVSEQLESVQLIPYGATLLHLPVLPEISDAPFSEIPQAEIVSYTTSVPFAATHADTAPPSLLIDGKWATAASQSVQYNSDVVITAKLAVPMTVTSASVYFYDLTKCMVDSIGVEVSVDGTTWESVAIQQMTFGVQSGATVPAYEYTVPVQRQAAYVRFTVKKTAESTRLLLGEITAR